MRLDKFLAASGFGTRKEVKQLIKSGIVTVDGKKSKSDKMQIDEKKAEVVVGKEKAVYQQFYYYLLNKPAGVVSATKDNYDRTVLDLLQKTEYRQDLFPVGRLDKDTEGLLVITNDGQLAHQLLSPKKHVEKEYYAKVSGIMTEEDRDLFARGLTIDQGEQTLPAELTIVATNDELHQSDIRLILHEGKFHQVKRMVRSVGKEVTYLKRIRMGGLCLPEDLPLGKYRSLTDEEIKELSKEN